MWKLLRFTPHPALSPQRGEGSREDGIEGSCGEEEKRGDWVVVDDYGWVLERFHG